MSRPQRTQEDASRGAGEGSGRTARSSLVPEGVFFAVRAGVEPVIAGWLLVVIPTVALYAAGSSLDAAAALSLGSALRTGTGLWGLALGGALGSASSDAGAIGLPLLGITALMVPITRWSVRRSALPGALAAAWAAGASALTALLLALLAGPAGSRTWTAAIGAALLTGIVAAVVLERAGRGSLRARMARSDAPPWLSPALGLLRTVARGLVVLAAAAFVVALITGYSRASTLSDALTGGAVVATIGVLLLELAWLPTALVWCLSWLIGPGFSVGTGSVFAPDQVSAGAVPSLPLLGLLPSAGIGSAGTWLPLVLTALGLVAAWRHRRTLAGLELRHSATAAAAAAVLAAVGVLIACLLASGPIGPGRMSVTGPRTAYTVALVLLELGVGLVAGSVLAHPATRRATERGVQRTEDASRALKDRRAAARAAEADGTPDDSAPLETAEPVLPAEAAAAPDDAADDEAPASTGPVADDAAEPLPAAVTPASAPVAPGDEPERPRPAVADPDDPTQPIDQVQRTEEDTDDDDRD